MSLESTSVEGLAGAAIGLTLSNSSLGGASFTPRITVPAKIYACIGYELFLYYDHLVLGIDKGLQSPLGFVVEIFCAKGQSYERFWKLNPIAGDAGTYEMKVRVFDLSHNLVKEKVISLIIQAVSALPTANNISLVGDSTEQVDTKALRLQATLAALGGTAPIFVGSTGNDPVKREGRGGYTFKSYATSGAARVRFDVSGVTTIGLASVYSVSGNTYTVIEVNITSGSGYITTTLTTGSATPEASGTLIKVSGTGDSTVSYSSTSNVTGNPFWNPSTSAIDIAYYRTSISLAGLINVMVIDLGVNDSFFTAKTEAQIGEILGYAKAIIAAFIANNPNCKIVIELPGTCGNTKGGWALNYGSSYQREEYISNIWRLREVIIEAFDQSKYSPNVSVGHANLGVDRYYGYTLQNIAIGDIITTTEPTHVNAVHPATVGYQQKADNQFPIVYKNLIS